MRQESAGNMFVDPDDDDGYLDSTEEMWDKKMDGVIKVYCIHTEPNFSMPWQRRRQYQSTSTGFVIDVERKRLLTNAHSVEHHTQVKVKKRGDDQKFLAKVLATGTECDIAMLTVDDPKFWEDMSALEFGHLPRLQEGVAVVGYPVGGDTISVTSGVVSRIEVTSYVHGMTDLLSIQIDAAINSGNSGGPVFNERQECVGIAFQSMRGEDAENIGYVIPTPVVEHFLVDYERNGKFTGFPMLGISWQTMESPALRAVLKMTSEQSGVLVREVQPTCPAAGAIMPNDIILQFNGIAISNDGTVPFRRGERIAFGYLVSERYEGEAVLLKLLRDGEVIDVETVLGKPTFLVPSHISGAEPSYYIVAGLVFITASELYLRAEFGSDYLYDAPVSLLHMLTASTAKAKGEQVVVLSQVLVADVNLGYEGVDNSMVKAVNGVPVTSLRQLAELAEGCEAPHLRLNLRGSELVVIDMAEARASIREILQTHNIPAAMSSDLLRDVKGIDPAGPVIDVPATASGEGSVGVAPSVDDFIEEVPSL